MGKIKNWTKVKNISNIDVIKQWTHDNTSFSVQIIKIDLGNVVDYDVSVQKIDNGRVITFPTFNEANAFAIRYMKGNSENPNLHLNKFSEKYKAH